MRRTLPVLIWILLLPAALSGQEARVREKDIWLHAEPGGARIAAIIAGTTVDAREVRDDWQEVTIAGWIWARSVKPDDRSGYDLVVGATNGENLRAEPNGDRIARFSRGALMKEVERDGQWIRVRRSGWVQKAGLKVTSSPPQQSSYDPATTERASLAGPETDSTPPPVDARAMAGDHGLDLLTSPGGQLLASLQPLAGLEVVEERGDWVRVRVEGWAPAAAIGSAAVSAPEPRAIAPEVLRSNPEKFKGRLIEWEIQFIAFDRAEKIRADFEEGELFILARPPGDQPGFVYLAAPEEALPRIRELVPLERVKVRARVRTGRSPQMAAPVLELIDIR